MAEHSLSKREVTGSNPVEGFFASGAHRKTDGAEGAPVVSHDMASIVQWLEYLPSKQVARVRFPVDASFSQRDVPVAKWIRRRFPEPKIEGSSPFRDAPSLLVHEWSSWL